MSTWNGLTVHNRAIRITYRERARFYEVEYDTTADWPFLQRLVTPAVKSILEVPSGVGRNTLWLAESGRFIVAADKEFAMIKGLRERLKAFSNLDSVYALVTDMRYLSLGMKFDLILVPQGGFQLLSRRSDALTALQSLRNHLAPNGKLMVDLAIFNPYGPGDESVRPRYYDPSKSDGELIQEWTRQLPTGGTLSRSRIQYHRRHLMITQFIYIVRHAAEEQILFYEMKSRRYTYEDFLTLCHEVGLKPEVVYRNYDYDLFEPHDDAHSSRMIFLLTNGEIFHHD